MRFVSFRFDDGFIAGARRAVELLAPDKASFFVLTRPDSLAKTAYSHLAADLKFGSREDWIDLSKSGQDVQPHSATHPNFAEISEEQASSEIAESVNFVADIHAGPYIFAFPFNVIPPQLDLSNFRLSAAGFETRNSAAQIQYNDLGGESFDLFRLKSWAICERHFHRIIAEIERAPEDSWTILGLHSLDGEGWEPWSSSAFAALVSHLRRSNFMIATVRDMVQVVGQRRGIALNLVQ